MTTSAEMAALPGPTSRPGGTGLGLPIAARIAERHEGSLSVESTPGRGTTVFVRIPVFAV
jgi:signal transduction histidine kinase